METNIQLNLVNFCLICFFIARASFVNPFSRGIRRNRASIPEAAINWFFFGECKDDYFMLVPSMVCRKVVL